MALVCYVAGGKIMLFRLPETNQSGSKISCFFNGFLVSPRYMNAAHIGLSVSYTAVAISPCVCVGVFLFGGDFRPGLKKRWGLKIFDIGPKTGFYQNMLIFVFFIPLGRVRNRMGQNGHPGGLSYD